MSPYLIRTLVIPVALAALVSLALGYFIPWQGLFINLAASLLGVLITIIYVDRVLQEHDRRVWQKVGKRIRQRADRFGYFTILHVRLALGLGHDVFDRDALNSADLQKALAEVVRVTENIIIPAVSTSLQRIDQVGWKTLVDSLEMIIRHGDRLIELHGQKLGPELLQAILDIQDNASEALTSYSIIPDLLGLPDDKLPTSNRVSTLGYRDASITLVARSIRQILMLALTVVKMPQQ